MPARRPHQHSAAWNLNLFCNEISFTETRLSHSHIFTASKYYRQLSTFRDSHWWMGNKGSTILSNWLKESKIGRICVRNHWVNLKTWRTITDRGQFSISTERCQTKTQIYILRCQGKINSQKHNMNRWSLITFLNVRIIENRKQWRNSIRPQDRRATIQINAPCYLLDWTLKQKEHINGKPSEIWIKLWVYIILFGYQLLGSDTSIMAI